MNKLLLAFALLCGGIQSACSQSEETPADPGGPVGPEPQEQPVVEQLTAPKDAFTCNLNAVSNLTFWWEQAQGTVEGYELVIDRAGDDFSSPLATCPAGNKTELKLPYAELKKIYDAAQQAGKANLRWTVNTLAGGKSRPGREQRTLTLTNEPVSYAVEALFVPADNDRADLTLLTDAVEFRWSAATGPKKPAYTLLFDREGGDFASPLASFDAGEETSVTLSKKDLRTLFDQHAAAGSQTLPLVWAVRSRVEQETWLSEVQHRLLVTTLPVSYSNPIFDAFSLPDPDVIRGDDGYFYLYATEHDRSDPNMKNSPIMRSEDLVHWTRVGSLFTDATHPQITDESAGIWAPSINKIGDKYVVYYSQPGKNYKHAIGVAVADRPEGPFTDHGKLIDSNEQGVDISIDAYLYQEDGRNYLFWGSFRGISVLELTADGLAIKDKANQKRRVVAGDQYEATVVHKRNGWYYLIFSKGDYSPDGNYHLVVGRSKSLFGPYTDKAGLDMKDVHQEIMLQGIEKVMTSPGHCSRIITDDNGQDWILYHAYHYHIKDFRCLMLDRIVWVDGWPIVPGLQPSLNSVAQPYFKK